MSLVLSAFLASAPPAPSRLEFDGGEACVSSGDAAQRVFQRHQHRLPEGTTVTVRLRAVEQGQSSLQIRAEGPSLPPKVEIQQVNRCSEAISYLGLYLEMWQPPIPEEAAGESDEVSSGADETARGVSGAPPLPTSTVVVHVELGTFANGSSNYEDKLGFGAGLQLGLKLDWWRLRAYGIWNQSDTLNGTSEQAAYTLERLDWGVVTCGQVMSLPLELSPCLGASARRFTTPAEHLAPGADTLAQVPSADAGLTLGKRVSSRFALDGGVWFRYGLQTLELNDIRVGEFAPAKFEVNLRIGLTFDIGALDVDMGQRSETNDWAQVRRGSSWQ